MNGFEVKSTQIFVLLRAIAMDFVDKKMISLKNHLKY